MPRRAPKKDDNHHQIVAVFERLGAHTEDVSMVEEFCDIIVTRAAKVAMVEIKDGAKTPSRRKLTPGEVKFKDRWVAAGGTWVLIETIDDVIKFLREW